MLIAMVALVVVALRVREVPRTVVRAAAAAPEPDTTRPPPIPESSGMQCDEAGTHPGGSAPAAEALPACRYAGYKQRLDAARQLATYDEGRHELNAALHHRDPAVRSVAALAYLYAPAEEDLDPVEGLLGDADWTVRFATALALVDVHVQRSGIWRPGGASARLRAAFPVERITRCLAEGRGATRADALRALSILHAEDNQTDTEALSLVLGAAPSLRDAVIGVLGDVLRSGPAELRPAAIDVLGRCGPAAADLAPLIVPSLDDEKDGFAAAVALLRIGHDLEAALPVLTRKVLEGKEWELNDILLIIDHSRPRPCEWRPALPLLRASLSGQGPLTPDDALRIVCHLGPEARDCVPELVRACGTPDLVPLAVCAFAALGDYGASAVPLLLAEIDHGGTCSVDRWCLPRCDLEILEPVAYAAEQVMWGTISEPAPRAVSRRELALRAGARAAPRDRVMIRVALRCLADPDDGVREAATVYLRDAVAAGDLAPAPLAARLVHDTSERVRRVAASVFRSALPEREEVIACLAGLLEAGDDFCRQYAARALGRSLAGNPAVEGALFRALDSEHVVARAWAAAALLGSELPCEERGSFEVARPRRMKATEILARTYEVGEPELRRLAVCSMIGQPPTCSNAVRTLALAAADSDSTVRILAGQGLSLLERASEAEVEDDIGDIFVIGHPATSVLVHALLDEPLTPVDVALRARAGDAAALRTLPAIAEDADILAFERWCVAEVLQELPARR